MNEIQKAIASFPATFGLRGFPGEVFMIDEGSSYTRGNGEIMLYTYVNRNGEWLAFAKGTVQELRAQVV